MFVAVCAIGDGAEKDLLVAVWSRRAKGESVVGVAEDSVRLVGERDSSRRLR